MENDELQEKLDQVLDQKNKYILPENIKKDITILGVTGTIDSSPLSNENNVTLTASFCARVLLTTCPS